MRIHIFIFALLLTVAYVPAQNPARIDINGMPSSNKLSFEKQENLQITHGAWLGKDAEKFLTVITVPSEEWKEAKVIFTPERDGGIRILLLGPYVRGGKNTTLKPAGVYYDDIKVNGKLISNGDFEAGTKGFSFPVREKGYQGRVITDPAIAHSGNSCALAWHDGQIMFRITVRANEPVVLSFWYRSAGDVPPVARTNHFYPVSLKTAANMGFADEIPGDGKGGWTDQGPKNDLRAFTPGVKQFYSRSFRVEDPAENQGRSCVIFKSKNAPYGKERITLPVNRRCNEIALLNGCGWAKTGTTAATVEVLFGNGKKEVFPLVIGKHTSDWWNPKQLPNAEIAWRSGGGGSGEIGLYSTVLKFKSPGFVRSVSITPGKDGVVFGLVAVTAGLVMDDPENTNYSNWKVTLGKQSDLTVLPVNLLKLEMNRKGIPAEKFFDEKKNWKRLEVLDEKGKKLEHCIVKFTRNFSPLIFVKTGGKTKSLELRIGKDKTGKILSPRAAFRKFTGKEKADHNDEAWGKGIFIRPDNAEKQQTQSAADEDSFYNTAEKMDSENPEWRYTFELKEPKKYHLYAYSQEPENHRNQIFVTVDGGETIKLGGNFCQPSTFYWSGGERISLGAGKHTIRIFPKTRRSWRKVFALSKVYLAEDQLSPVQPGIADELAALKQAGIYVYGTGASIPWKNTAGPDPLFRSISEKHSFPDLSSLTDRIDIDRSGAPSVSGGMFRFADGTAIPQIWGCNVNTYVLYTLAMENRIGGDSLDRFMKRLKGMGYSSIRYMISTLPREWTMNVNNCWPPLLSRDPLKFSPEFLTNIQKLIAACHKNGIYLFLTLWHDNCFFTDLGAERNNHPYIGFFHPEAIRRQKEIVKMILSPPNPYRGGLPPAKDPTLLIYEIENERTYVATYAMNNPSNWRKLPVKTREILYGLWSNFLKDKYKTTEELAKNWNLKTLESVRRPGKTDDSFESVDFPPAWDIKEWGKDSSEFKVKLDDLRISEASFGKEKRSNPMVSDGLEFMYAVYRDYLKEMYSYARSLGFKGIITSNGPDCELHYSQRAGANEILDAVSGGTGYWNRTGYGFLRSLGWLAPMVYASAPGKPVISREYGANLVFENNWWGNLIAASVQKAMGKAYLYNFALGLISTSSSDWFYPEDNFEKVQGVNLNQDKHLYSHFANLASAIAVRSQELKKPEFELEIAFPLENICYAAPFRGYNKLTLDDYTPFLYTDSSIRTFRGPYRSNADMTVNEPSLPAGDYSSAKNLFALRPHSAWNRYGRPENDWFKDKKFRSNGFMNKGQERKAFYDALRKAGAELPVAFDEFGKVWRDAGKHLEIDTRTASFRAETSEFSSFIGNLDTGKGKMPKAFSLSGKDGAWSFLGKLPDSGELFFAVMNGIADLKKAEKVKYLFLGGRDLKVLRNGKAFVHLFGGDTVNIALKSEEPLWKAKTVYVTFFRNRSGEIPSEIVFARKIRKAEACGRDGEVLAKVPCSGGTFRNLWESGSRISYYRITF